MDLSFVRSRFPAFSEPSLRERPFFENAGGSYACAPVIDRLTSYYRRNKVQPYYPYPASSEAGDLMDASYRRLAGWLGVTPDEVHFGPSTSQNTYVMAQAALGWLRPGDEIVVSNQEHEANGGAWRRLATHGITVREWPVHAETGALSLDDLDGLLTRRTRLVAFTQCSNILGQINPVADIAARVHDAGAVCAVDGVSYAPHGFPDVAALGADLYFFSLYKTYGPHQGLMVVRRHAAEHFANQSHYFNAGEIHKRFVPAGPDHAQVAAAQGVADYFDELVDHHWSHPPADRRAAVAALLSDAERARLAPLLEFLRAHPRVRIVGPDTPAQRAPTVSIVTEGLRCEALTRRVAEYGIGSGFGHFYSARLLDALGIGAETGVTRFSFVHYTSDDDVTRLIEALDQSLA